MGAERRLLVLGVAFGASLTLALQVAIYPSLRDSFAEMSEGLPEAFTRLIGSEDFASPEGFLQAEAYGTMAPLLVVLVAISMAGSGIPRAESSGRMMLLATSSVTRRDIAVGAALSVIVAVSKVVAVYGVATILGSEFAGLDIRVDRLLAAAFSLWLLGLAIGAIAFAAAAATGSRAIAIACGSSVTVVSFLNHGLLPLSDSLAPGRYFSLWYPYADPKPLENGFDLASTVVLLAVSVSFFAWGVDRFRRRDLG